jgi:hypothetical protein
MRVVSSERGRFRRFRLQLVESQLAESSSERQELVRVEEDWLGGCGAVSEGGKRREVLSRQGGGVEGAESEMRCRELLVMSLRSPTRVPCCATCVASRSPVDGRAGQGRS